MDRDKRVEFIASKRPANLELEARFSAHLNEVTELWQDRNTTGFDLDLATEFHPDLLDGTTPEGQAALHFYHKLYTGLGEQSPRYTVFSGRDLNNQLYLRVFKYLQPSNIAFKLRTESEEASLAVNGLDSIQFASSGFSGQPGNLVIFRQRYSAGNPQNHIPTLKFGETLSVVNTAIGDVIARSGYSGGLSGGLNLKSADYQAWVESERAELLRISAIHSALESSPN